MASGDVVKVIGSADAEIGKITAFGHEAADPLKYKECVGTAVSRTTYAKLFAKVGESFGAGDGSTTFNLPDFTDQFLRGNSGSRAVGNSQEDATAKNGLGGSGTAAPDGRHKHTYSIVSGHNYDGPYGYDSNSKTSYDRDTSYAPDHTHSVSLSITSTDAETRPKNIAVKYYIRFEG